MWQARRRMDVVLKANRKNRTEATGRVTAMANGAGEAKTAEFGSLISERRKT
jgi:hypothetical protein